MASTNFVMQVVAPQTGINPLNHKNTDNSTYAFPFDVVFTVPMPSWDGWNLQQSVMVDGGRNANGDFEGIVIGNPKHKISPFQWKGLTPDIAQPLIQYFANKKHFTFYARYFDLITNTFIIRQFYRGDMKIEPNMFVPIKDEQDTIIGGTVDKYNLIQVDVVEV